MIGRVHHDMGAYYTVKYVVVEMLIACYLLNMIGYLIFYGSVFLPFFLDLPHSSTLLD